MIIPNRSEPRNLNTLQLRAASKVLEYESSTLKPFPRCHLQLPLHTISTIRRLPRRRSILLQHVEVCRFSHVFRRCARVYHIGCVCSLACGREAEKRTRMWCSYNPCGTGCFCS